MSIPTAVFIDTSVFRGQSYNFSSTAFSTFVPACKHRNLTLLLPDPMEREVNRQMAALSEKAVGFIDNARRTAPFLAKWKGFPPTDSHKGLVRHFAATEWRSFLKQFDVVRLNYDGVWTVKRDYDVSGTAKVSLDAKTNALFEIPFVALNEEEIEVTEIPPYWHRWR